MRTLILSILLSCCTQAAFAQSFVGGTAGVGVMRAQGGSVAGLRPFLGIAAGNTMKDRHRYGLSLILANRKLRTEKGVRSPGTYYMHTREISVSYLYLSPYIDLVLGKKGNWFIAIAPAFGLRLGGKYAHTFSYNTTPGGNTETELLEAGAGYLSPTHFSLNFSIGWDIEMSGNIVASPFVSFAPAMGSFLKENNVAGSEWRFGVNLRCSRAAKRS